MRFGAPVLDAYGGPEEWIEILKRRGYRAANSPVSGTEGDDVINAYARAAKEADIVIAEQGAWNCNCLDYDEKKRRAAVDHCAAQLAVADRLNARCCVALAGSRAPVWDAPHRDNFSEDTFALAVDNIRAIIDGAKPARTFFTLEPMPWTLPYDADSQERLLKAVDRKAFAVHYDPVNLVYSPDRFYNSGRYITDFIHRLGAHIRVCHVKDVQLVSEYVLQLHERIPGDGGLDYAALFRGLDQLDPDLPITTEHLTRQEDYDKGERFIRGKLAELGISLH